MIQEYVNLNFTRIEFELASIRIRFVTLKCFLFQISPFSFKINEIFYFLILFCKTLNPKEKRREEDEGGRSGGKHNLNSCSSEEEKERWRSGIRETRILHPTPHSPSHPLHPLTQAPQLRPRRAPLLLPVAPNPRAAVPLLLP